MTLMWRPSPACCAAEWSTWYAVRENILACHFCGSSASRPTYTNIEPSLKYDMVWKAEMEAARWLATDIMQCVVAHSDCAAKERHDAAEAHVVSHQIC